MIHINGFFFTGGAPNWRDKLKSNPAPTTGAAARGGNK